MGYNCDDDHHKEPSESFRKKCAGVEIRNSVWVNIRMMMEKRLSQTFEVNFQCKSLGICFVMPIPK